MHMMHSHFHSQPVVINIQAMAATHHHLNQRLQNESFHRPYDCPAYPVNQNPVPSTNPYHSDVVHSHPSHVCNIGESSNDSLSNQTFRSSQSDVGVLTQQECFDSEQVPQGPYSPELGASDNPHYFSVNQMLYEAHVSRMRRCTDQESL